MKHEQVLTTPSVVPNKRNKDEANLPVSKKPRMWKVANRNMQTSVGKKITNFEYDDIPEKIRILLEPGMQVLKKTTRKRMGQDFFMIAKKFNNTYQFCIEGRTIATANDPKVAALICCAHMIDGAINNVKTAQTWLNAICEDIERANEWHGVQQGKDVQQILELRIQYGVLLI